MAVTETNSLTINKGALYPFIYQPRNGVTYTDETTALEASILAIRVNNAEEGFFYRIRYLNYKPKDLANSGTSNGWAISKISKDAYLAGVAADIDLTSASTTKFRLDPEGGVQRFTLKATNGGSDTSFDIVMDPAGMTEITYIHSTTTKGSYQHIIDPIFYNIKQSSGSAVAEVKDALTINKGSLYPFVKEPRGNITYDTSKPIPSDIESAILSVRVKKPQKGYYYFLRYFYHVPDGDETSTNNGWTFSKIKIEDYKAGLSTSQADVTRSFECHKKLDMTKDVERFTLTAGNGDATSFDVVVASSAMPTTSKAYVVSETMPGFQHIIDPIFYEYDPLDNDDTAEKVSAISKHVRKVEMNPEKPTLTCTAFGILPIDAFNQPRFDNLLLYRAIDSQTTPASVTKLMTAIVAIESGMPLDRVITIQESDLTVGSGYNLAVGDQLTLESALYNLLLVSSNTSATAIARAVGEYLGGGFDKFIQLMNTKAAKYGMSNTNFTNPSGVVDSNHYTTVKALMLLGWRASLNPTLTKIWATKQYTLSIAGPNAKDLALESTSLEVSQNPWFIGSKTGSIVGWGYNMLAYIHLKNGFRGVVVCIKSNSPEERISDVEALVNYVRENYAYPAPAKIVAKQ